MKYIDLKNIIGPHKIFSFQELKITESNFPKNNLLSRQKKGYIGKLKKGRYYFKDQNITETTMLYIANRIYEPSYISLELALNQYNIIPEGVYKWTSITSKKSQTIHTELGTFKYHSVKPNLMFGYKIIRKNGIFYKIAELEKAIIDYFYINKHYKTTEDFYELRFNLDELKKQLNYQKLKTYTQQISQKTFQNTIKNFLEFIKSDDGHYKY